MSASGWLEVRHNAFDPFTLHRHIIRHITDVAFTPGSFHANYISPRLITMAGTVHRQCRRRLPLRKLASASALTTTLTEQLKRHTMESDKRLSDEERGEYLL